MAWATASMLKAVVAAALFHGSQAFFAAPVAPRIVGAGSPTCGATSSGPVRSCSHWVSDTWCSRRGGVAEGSRATGVRFGGVKPLRVNKLEEVPEDLVDKVLTLEDEETGRVIECYAERFAIVDGQRYLAAFPKDPSVAIAFEENGEVAPVPLEDPLMDELFPIAEESVKDLGPGVKLLRTPATLTVHGLEELQGDDLVTSDFEVEDKVPNFYDDDEDDTIVLRHDVEEGDDEAEDDQEEEDEEEEELDGLDALADEVELLVEFLLEGEEFLLVRFMEPLLVLAKQTEDGRFVLIDEESDQDTNPIVENMLAADAL